MEPTPPPPTDTREQFIQAFMHHIDISRRRHDWPEWLDQAVTIYAESLVNPDVTVYVKPDRTLLAMIHRKFALTACRLGAEDLGLPGMQRPWFSKQVPGIKALLARDSTDQSPEA